MGNYNEFFCNLASLDFQLLDFLIARERMICYAILPKP
jgi:hypothetical protein